jgi:hypothetical protein
MKTTKTSKAKTPKAVTKSKAVAAPKAKLVKTKAAVTKRVATKPAPALTVAPVREAAPKKKVFSTEEIARRAYSIWEQQGRPSGKEREHWLLAEQQLQAA